MEALLLITPGTLILSASKMHFESLTASLVFVMVITAAVCFVVSELTLNYSQVDKLWSIMPIVYSTIAFLTSPSPRLGLMTILVIIWGLRLSFNFGRKRL